MTPINLYKEFDDIVCSLVKNGTTPIRLIIDENTHEEVKNQLNEHYGEKRVKNNISDVSFSGIGDIPIQVIPSEFRIVSFVVR